MSSTICVEWKENRPTQDGKTGWFFVKSENMTGERRFFEKQNGEVRWFEVDATPMLVSSALKEEAKQQSIAQRLTKPSCHKVKKRSFGKARALMECRWNVLSCPLACTGGVFVSKEHFREMLSQTRRTVTRAHSPRSHLLSRTTSFAAVHIAETDEAPGGKEENDQGDGDP